MFFQELNAAKVLLRNGCTEEGSLILKHVWESSPLQSAPRFEAFAGLFEVYFKNDKREAVQFLQRVLDGEELHDWVFALEAWERATLHEWLGQAFFVMKDRESARQHLSRAAASGRDTALGWFMLSDLALDEEDCDLSARYLRRSLFVSSQSNLRLLGDQEHALGQFLGEDLLGVRVELKGYMECLLRFAKVAHSPMQMKILKETVMDLIHAFPRSENLLKIRTLVERKIVSQSVAEPNYLRASRM
jgi:tetratricopeptide (TPR) repeat protein